MNYCITVEYICLPGGEHTATSLVGYAELFR